MDIYTILASKPHNPHYLNRYITFIQNCQLKNIDYNGYTEKHHICPKAKDMFPEYKSFKINNWNRVILTARQHFIAHWLLARIYGGTMWNAFNMMCICKNNTQERYIIKSGRIYQEVRRNIKMSEETKKKISESHKGKIITKETRNKIGAATKGRKCSKETRQKISEVGNRTKKEKSLLMSRKMWFNNGVLNKRLDPENEDTSGWISGRLKFIRTKREKWNENRKKRRTYEGGENPAARKVCVTGLTFNTLTEAAAANNCRPETVRNRCKSAKFNDWYFI